MKMIDYDHDKHGVTEVIGSDSNINDTPFVMTLPGGDQKQIHEAIKYSFDSFTQNSNGQYTFVEISIIYLIQEYVGKGPVLYDHNTYSRVELPITEYSFFKEKYSLYSHLKSGQIAFRFFSPVDKSFVGSQCALACSITFLFILVLVIAYIWSFPYLVIMIIICIIITVCCCNVYKIVSQPFKNKESVVVFDTNDKKIYSIDTQPLALLCCRKQRKWHYIGELHQFNTKRIKLTMNGKQIYMGRALVGNLNKNVSFYNQNKIKQFLQDINKYDKIQTLLK